MNAVVGFVPPEGAMQFQLDEKQVPSEHGISGAKKQDFLWVMPPVKNLMPCPCKVSYPIVIDSLTPHNRKLAKETLRHRSTVLCTCACQGRIIE